VRAEESDVRRSIWLAAAVTVVLPLSACARGGDGGGSDGPIRIAYMDILQGPNAIKDGDRALKMAIDEVNAAGGIDGRKVEYKSYNTDITPAGATTATNLALKDNPTIIIGYGVSAGLKASIPAINQAGIPVLHRTLAALTSPKSLGSDLTFRMGPTTEMYAKAGDGHLITSLGAKKLLIVHTSDAAPTEGAAAIKKDAAAAGVEVVERAVPPTVTDLTEAVLAARGVDAVWEWGYATTDGLFLKQLKQNGVDVPVNTFSAGSAASSGLIPADLLTKNVSYVAACGVDTLQTPTAEEFRAKYAKSFPGQPIEPFNPTFYDAVHLLKAAVEKAGTTEPKALAKALADVTYDGICGTYKADANHNMIHNVPVVNFPDGKAALVNNYTDVPSSF
jgi:branched-chain amino acid transport system substrate-binding protein